jgi:hypothetical protein
MEGKVLKGITNIRCGNMTEKTGFSTVDEILDDVVRTLPLVFREKIKETTCESFCLTQQLDLGLVIRNKYFFQNPSRDKLIENLGAGIDFLLLDGDEFSELILEKLYERITTVKK